MTQNRSTAVMQRRVEPHTSLDDFPTPPWATRALIDWLRKNCRLPVNPLVCEPAANRGFMVKPIAEEFQNVRASDVHDYGCGYEVNDYLFGEPKPADITITNPPFRLAEEFVTQAMKSGGIVCMFLRSAFVEGEGRYSRLFSRLPPTDILTFSERVVLWKGLLLDPEVRIYRYDRRSGDCTYAKPTSATSYSWFVWTAVKYHTRFHFIPPGTRKLLTHPGDYPPLPDHLSSPQGAERWAQPSLWGDEATKFEEASE